MKHNLKCCKLSERKFFVKNSLLSIFNFIKERGSVIKTQKSRSLLFWHLTLCNILLFSRIFCSFQITSPMTKYDSNGNILKPNRIIPSQKINHSLDLSPICPARAFRLKTTVFYIHYSHNFSIWP